MKRLLISTLAAAPLLLALPAGAQPTMTLQSRSSVNYFYYFGGFAISGDEGEDGAPAPVPGGPWEGTVLTGFAEPTLAIAGSDHHDIQYLGWTGFLDESWNQAQTYRYAQTAAGAELHIEGHATSLQTSQVCGPTPCAPASELHVSTNTLALEFSLDTANPYTLAGNSSGGQYVDLLVWNELAQRWHPIVFGPLQTKDTAFSLSGTLAGGRYMLRNNPAAQRAGGPDDVVNTWNATLTLAGAVATAVPEPTPVALLAAGLASLALWRRRHAPH
jgi:hypothetical protein